MNMPSDEPSQPEQPVVSEPSNPLTTSQSIVVSPSQSSNKGRAILGFVVLLIAVGFVAYFTLHSSKQTATTTANVIPTKNVIPAQVSITNAGFVPSRITVKVGNVVTWTNSDTALHWVASDPYPTDNTLADFNAEQGLSQNDNFSFVFNKVGTYTYHDNLNPYTIKGTVVVE
jgi:plastocyanin